MEDLPEANYLPGPKRVSNDSLVKTVEQQNQVTTVPLDY